MYNMRSTIDDKDKLEGDDKEKMEGALKEALEWMEEQKDVEKDDNDDKLREVKAICNPVIKREYVRSGHRGSTSADQEHEEEEDSHYEQ